MIKSCRFHIIHFAIGPLNFRQHCREETGTVEPPEHPVPLTPDTATSRIDASYSFRKTMYWIYPYLVSVMNVQMIAVRERRYIQSTTTAQCDINSSGLIQAESQDHIFNPTFIPDLTGKPA